MNSNATPNPEKAPSPENSRDLLDQLADLARQEEQGPEAEERRRWEALAAGNLDDGDEKALRDQAEKSPEAKAALDAYRPLGSDFHARMAELAGRELEADNPPSNIIDARGRWPRWAPMSALVAALLLFVLWPAGPSAPLPHYTLLVNGQSQALRSDAAIDSPPSIETPAPLRFAVGNRLNLVFGPGSDLPEGAKNQLEVHSFRVQDGAVRTLDAPPAELAVGGAARLVGVIGRDIDLPLGESTLVVRIGWKGRAPSDTGLWQRLEAIVGPDPLLGEGWTAWKIPIEVVPEDGEESP